MSIDVTALDLLPAEDAEDDVLQFCSGEAQTCGLRGTCVFSF